MTTGKSVQELDAAVCKDAEQFTKLFYEAFDRRRMQVSKMYTAGACMVWNGNPLSGQELIHQFLTSLPPSEHMVKSADAQAVPEHISGNGKTIVIQTAGTVKYNELIHMFTQTFILSTEDDLLKIASDRFRFID